MSSTPILLIPYCTLFAIDALNLQTEETVIKFAQITKKRCPENFLIFQNCNIAEHVFFSYIMNPISPEVVPDPNNY